MVLVINFDNLLHLSANTRSSLTARFSLTWLCKRRTWFSRRYFYCYRSVLSRFRMAISLAFFSVRACSLRCSACLSSAARVSCSCRLSVSRRLSCVALAAYSASKRSLRLSLSASLRFARWSYSSPCALSKFLSYFYIASLSSVLACSSSAFFCSRSFTQRC